MRVRFPASQAAFPRVEDLFAKFTHPATSATCVSADLLRGIVNQARKSLCLKAPDLRLVFSEGDDGEAQELTIADYSGQYSATLPARALRSTPIPAAEREVGGLGIFLVKKSMDGMEYARRDGKNVLTIRKKI